LNPIKIEGAGNNNAETTTMEDKKYAEQFESGAAAGIGNKRSLGCLHERL
jgi:hypothetical protein